MTNPEHNKKYPLASDEVAKMLGFRAAEDSRALPVVDEGNGSEGKAPEDLPVNHMDLEEYDINQEPESDGPRVTEKGKVNYGVMLKAIKTLAPYMAVFVIGVFLYFFFFTNMDLFSVFKMQSKAKTPQQSALEQLQKQGLDGYNKWIAQFYYDVSDRSVLDPDRDNSGNGLTNFQKYLLNLNPKSYDTMGLGMADSEALVQGLNPLTGAALNDRQKEIVNKYFDMEVVMNRLTLAHMQSQNGQVAGVATQDGQQNYRGFDQEPSNSSSTGTAFPAAPIAADLDIDTAVAGRLEIPSLGVNVPIIWTQDTKDFDKDLRSGVVHYPGTAMPGQIGTAYISGHSSNYIWAKGDYNNVFAKLGDLKENASFKITVVQKNGKDAILHYVTVGSQQYDAKDQAQFRNSAQSVVALSTCWPVGSTAKRLVVFGQLTQVEK